MSILDIFHHISCPWMWDQRGPQYFTGVIAVLGKEITLIDTGTVDSPESAILPFIRKMGRQATEIRDIVLTHGHGDHIDGISGLLELSKPAIHIHELDAPKLKTLAEKASFEPSIIKCFKDGQILELSGRELRVIHTPGHSEGSVCILDETSHICASGDSIQGRGKGRPLLFFSTTEYESSMNRLLGEFIGVLMLGHPFPPYEKGVLRNAMPKTFIKHSLEALTALRGEFAEVLEGLTGPFGIEDIMAHFPDLRDPTIRCLLDEFSDKGRLELSEDSSGRVCWVKRF